MAELIGMPRAAWRRQPTGNLVIRPEWSSGLSLVYSGKHQLEPYGGNLRTSIFSHGSVVMTPAGLGSYQRVISYAANPFLQPLSAVSVLAVLWVSQMNIGTQRVFQAHEATASSYYPGYVMSISNTGAVFAAGNASSVITEITSPISTGVRVLLGSFGRPDLKLYIDGTLKASGTRNTDISYNNAQHIPIMNAYWAAGLGGSSIVNTQYLRGAHILLAVWRTQLSEVRSREITTNPWQLFAPDPPRFFLIPSGGSSPTSQISIDALIQRTGLTQSTSLDALLQSAFSRSLSIDGLIAATQAGTISLDALLQIVGTRTVSVDALVQAVKSGTVSVDALVQMTLAQSLSLDALIVAASASSASTDLDALIQALKTAGLSLDALLSKPMTVASVMDALIQAAKTGTVSLDAIITGASSTTVFVGLDALIQAIQAKTISLDALLQKSYTSPLALDAYVALTQVKTIGLDALLQSTKSGVISLDAILQMTKTAMVLFDALIQAAKAGVISLDAILVFATQASVLLDAYVQKTLSAGVGLDAIIGAIADMILPTGRVITVPASDRFVFVTHSDRVIQIQ